MKRYTVISIALLVGFIAGCAVPAHAESNTATFVSAPVQIPNTEYCKSYPAKCEPVIGRGVVITVTRPGVIKYSYTQDGKFYANTGFYAKVNKQGSYDAIDNTADDTTTIIFKGDYVNIVRLNPKSPFDPQYQVIESFFRVSE